MSTRWCAIPIFQAQSGDAFEFTQVAGHQGQATGQGLPGYQDVVGADGSAAGGQHGANFSRVASVFGVERQHFEAQSVDERQIAVAALALEGAVIKLMHDDGTDTHVSRHQRVETAG